MRNLERTPPPFGWRRPPRSRGKTLGNPTRESANKALLDGVLLLLIGPIAFILGFLIYPYAPNAAAIVSVFLGVLGVILVVVGTRRLITGIKLSGDL